MNTTLTALLACEVAVKTLQQKLPCAFEMAEFESYRVRMDHGTGVGKIAIGQEVGFLRERVILSFLSTQLGNDKVQMPAAGQGFVEASVMEYPLDIKTVTKRNLITAKWTSDNTAVDKVIENFRFVTDMLLVRIWWGRNQDSVFYIPAEVLREVADSMPEYLYSKTGTNNRGVKVKNAFMKEAECHKDTVRVPIDWKKTNGSFEDPIDRYVNYWKAGNHTEN